MRLRWQIACIALLSLAFPVVLWLSFYSLNQSFQSGWQQQQTQQTQLLASSLNNYAKDHMDSLDGFYIEALETPILLDGLRDEWEGISARSLDESSRYWLAQKEDDIYFFLQTSDRSIYTELPDNDRAILMTGDARGIQRLVFNRQASGDIRSKNLSDTDYQAYWRESSTGYNLEIKLTQTDITRIGIAVVDQQKNSIKFAATQRIDQPSSVQQSENIYLKPIAQQQPHWQTFLSSITPANSEIKLLDTDDIEIYQYSQLPEDTEPSLSWLESILYDLIFNTEDSYRQGTTSVTKAYDYGSFQLTTASNAAQQQLISLFLRSLSLIVMLVLVLIAVYLLYASILAWRIKKLNRQLHNALDTQGEIRTALPSAHARDEIGDLSRATSSLLVDINSYTNYLKELGGRLSHEMRTPLSIVKTSLENMSMNTSRDEADGPFLNRAMDAVQRLNFILKQLSELSQLKQSIADTQKHTFNLTAFVQQISSAYQSMDQRIKVELAAEDYFLHGSDDLIAQLLDKLIDNARDFAGRDDKITITLSRLPNSKQRHNAKDTFNQSHKNHNLLLSVSNTGSQIPEHDAHLLFDSLYSNRNTSHSSQQDTAHLGLGLSIAKLIAEFHQGNLQALNQTNPERVEFRLEVSAQIIDVDNASSRKTKTAQATENKKEN